MRLATIIVLVLVTLFAWGAVASAAGPTPGHGPWVACSNNNPACASQLGPDIDPSNEVFDCLTRNGRLGHALQNSNTGAAKCWAN